MASKQYWSLSTGGKAFAPLNAQQVQLVHVIEAVRAEPLISSTFWRMALTLRAARR
jgi:hypothetical protein